MSTHANGERFQVNANGDTSGTLLMEFACASIKSALLPTPGTVTTANASVTMSPKAHPRSPTKRIAKTGLGSNGIQIAATAKSANLRFATRRNSSEHPAICSGIHTVAHASASPGKSVQTHTSTTILVTARLRRRNDEVR